MEIEQKPNVGISSKHDYLLGELKSLHKDINKADAMLAIEVTTREIFSELEAVMPNIKNLYAYDKLKRKWMEC